MRTRNWLLVAAITFSLLVAGVVMAGKSTTETPQLPSDQNEACLCNKNANLVIPGMGTFRAQLHGSINVGATNLAVGVDGRQFVPLNVKGYTERGWVDGLGDTHVWLDKSRPTTGSFLREITPGTGFPAVQEIHMHFMMTTDGLPGRMFRTLEPVVLRSEEVNSFPPPKGTSYHTVGDVIFEDVDEPGVEAARIVDVSVKVAGAA
ncbi:MAG: hypothetical protein AAF481_20320 [Acidobacteriota bacterium]